MALSRYALSLAGAVCGVAVALAVLKRRKPSEATNGTEGSSGRSSEDIRSLQFDASGAELRRLRRVEAALRDRIGKAVVVIERMGNSHNFAAVLRTAEAMGFQHIYVVAVNADVLACEPRKRVKKKGKESYQEDAALHDLHCEVGRGATQWLTLHLFRTAADAIANLKDDGFDIWVTDLSQKAEALSHHNNKLHVPEKLAFVIGTEGSGVSQTFIDAADDRVFLPMTGLADSYNAR
jgi:tRNA (guanosine-2'-O-)-methyltransferase